MRFLIAAVAMLPILSSPASSQTEWSTVETKGKWQYMAKIDGFSDQRRCVIIYNDDMNIQLASKSLAFGFKQFGGLKDYQMRIDDGRIIEKKPDDYDRENGLVYLDGDDLLNILNARRFRVQVSTTWQGAQQRDLDMTGAKELRDRLIKECPGE